MLPVAIEALEQAGCSWEDMDAIAVTQGPGLVGALLVGVAAAKAAAWALDKPLVAVNHMEGHIFANLLQYPDLEPPFLSLVVSGGHTMIVVVKDYNTFQLLGQTRDDAAGKPSIRLPGSWVILILAAPISTGWLRKEILMPFRSPWGLEENILLTFPSAA